MNEKLSKLSTTDRLGKNTDRRRTSHDGISRVQVFSLFNQFDHSIALDLSSRITIIHGENGIGKTIILRMIKGIMEENYRIFYQIPFKKFRLDFVSGDFISLTSVRRDEVEKDKGADERIKFHITLGGEDRYGELPQANRSKIISTIRRRIGNNWIFNQELDSWTDTSDGEVVSTDDWIVRFELNIPAKTAEDHRELEYIARKCNIRFIGTDRLTTEFSSADRSHPIDLRDSTWRTHHSHGRTEAQKSVIHYSNELKNRLNNVTEQYGTRTTQLDRSFVKRVTKATEEVGRNNNLDSNELVKKLLDLESKRRGLIKAGLLEEEGDETAALESSPQEIQTMVDASPQLCSVYVDDMQNKLALFDDLANKVKILSGRTNLRFSNKQLYIDRNEGVVFETNKGSRISPTDLSSGEQHQFVLFFQLIFLSRSGDLILLDEPELSMHVDWQLSLLEDLQQAFAGLEIDVLMATHSPAIVSGMEKSSWVPLKGNK